MLKTAREKAICEKYGARDAKGFVHCDECPLNISDRYDLPLACKATHHYDRHLRDWVLDEDEEETEDEG